MWIAYCHQLNLQAEPGGMSSTVARINSVGLKLALRQLVIRNQCDQIEQFLKVLGNKFAYKSSLNKINDFFTIMKKLAWVLFRQLLETFGHFLLQHLVTLFLIGFTS